MKTAIVSEQAALTGKEHSLCGRPIADIDDEQYRNAWLGIDKLTCNGCRVTVDDQERLLDGATQVATPPWAPSRQIAPDSAR